MLTDLEQTLKRMKGYLGSNPRWNQAYDYTVHFLARFLFTICSRINNVLGIHETTNMDQTHISKSYGFFYYRVSAMVTTTLSFGLLHFYVNHGSPSLVRSHVQRITRIFQNSNKIG